MRDPEPAVVLECGHVEHPPASGHCQTTDCPNGPHPQIPLMEHASMMASALILGWVQSATGRGAVEILMDSLPGLV